MIAIRSPTSGDLTVRPTMQGMRYMPRKHAIRHTCAAVHKRMTMDGTARAQLNNTDQPEPARDPHKYRWLCDTLLATAKVCVAQSNGRLSSSSRYFGIFAKHTRQQKSSQCLLSPIAVLYKQPLRTYGLCSASDQPTSAHQQRKGKSTREDRNTIFLVTLTVLALSVSSFLSLYLFSARSLFRHSMAFHKPQFEVIAMLQLSFDQRITQKGCCLSLQLASLLTRLAYTTHTNTKSEKGSDVWLYDDVGAGKAGDRDWRGMTGISGQEAAMG